MKRAFLLFVLLCASQSFAMIQEVSVKACRDTTLWRIAGRLAKSQALRDSRHAAWTHLGVKCENAKGFLHFEKLESSCSDVFTEDKDMACVICRSVAFGRCEK